MIANGRKTKQGLRDLNYYGPRLVKGAVEGPPAETVADGEAAVEAPTPAPLEPSPEGTSGK